MIVVLNKKLVMCSQTQLDFLKEGPSEGFDSFEVCLWLVHPTNQLFHSTSCAVIWLFPQLRLARACKIGVPLSNSSQHVAFPFPENLLVTFAPVKA